MGLKKELIAASFSQAASHYDNSAVLQQEVASRVFERLGLMRVNPKHILDVGCGTGACSRRLRDSFGAAKITAVDIAPGMIEIAKKEQRRLRKIDYQVADADCLPFDNNQFDLVFSSLVIQWMPDLKATFSELNRVLAPGGLLIFSTLGPDTLMELKQSWLKLDNYTHVNDFIDMHIIGDQVVAAGFENVVIDRDVITLTYRTMTGLMRDLKAVGARNLNHNRARGLLGKQKFNRLQAAYEHFRWETGELPATYEVIYGHAWKKHQKAQESYHAYPVDVQPPKKT